MYLPSTEPSSSGGVYWSSTDAGHQNNEEMGWALNMIVHNKNTHAHYFVSFKKNVSYAVRPVLAKETVLWGEQNIK